MKVALLTAGDDPNYAYPLTASLASRGIIIDFIGNDQMQRAEITTNEKVNYLNLRGDQSEDVPRKEKVYRVLKYYWKLIKYTAKTDTGIFHILWLNKFIIFDRTILNIYYKLMGKKLVFTAHNINAAERDGNDSFINRLTLKFMYKIVDHVIVHTEKMKQQLIEDFKIEESKITVIPFGINEFIPVSELSTVQARDKLNIGNNEKILLFFGRIAPYKGLEYIIQALANLREKRHDLRLIIAGKIQRNCDAYFAMIERTIKEHNLEKYIIEKTEFIPDEDIEFYFKAADVLILPYKHIFQSGPLFMSYNFGLPVIASDVGSFKEDVIEGETGLIFKSRDPEDLAEKINQYFSSDLFRNIATYRNRIIEYANDKYSWEKNGETIDAVYRSLL